MIKKFIFVVGEYGNNIDWLIVFVGLLVTLDNFTFLLFLGYTPVYAHYSESGKSPDSTWY